MNERYVSIKVDREERPDIDAVYMEATQALTGRGGWPMTVFLDHDGRAFLAGTYFPPGGARRDALVHRRAARRGSDLARGPRARRRGGPADPRRARTSGSRPPARRRPDPTLRDVTAAVDALAAQFDAARGGFGGAPKFPPSMVLEFLLRATP